MLEAYTDESYSVTITSNFKTAVLNSVGANVTVMSTLPLAGTTPTQSVR